MFDQQCGPVLRGMHSITGVRSYAFTNRIFSASLSSIVLTDGHFVFKVLHLFIQQLVMIMAVPKQVVVPICKWGLPDPRVAKIIYSCFIHDMLHQRCYFLMDDPRQPRKAPEGRVYYGLCLTTPRLVNRRTTLRLGLVQSIWHNKLGQCYLQIIRCLRNISVELQQRTQLRHTWYHAYPDNNQLNHRQRQQYHTQGNTHHFARRTSARP